MSQTDDLSHFHLLFQDASNTWHVAKEGQIQSYSKLGFERLLPSINSSHRDAFIKDHLQTLPDYPYLMNTLIAFIAHSRNRKETARALYIHPNTLYQRLKKVEDETSKCIDQEEDWLNLMIAVSFYKLDIPN
ncbi:helix-turn-helix domain-containing protein [Shouchella sp. 1P09AA]|uniref:PucR family transcriptional regulator n=1 Tax=unclassified Shouchella TaxID=2893065 RepID=UPI0039A274B3